MLFNILIYHFHSENK